MTLVAEILMGIMSFLTLEGMFAWIVYGWGREPC